MADDLYDNHSDGEIPAAKNQEFENDGESNFKRDSRKERLGKEPLIKVLVPNDAAGAIIGKGGGNLGDLKSRYGATIRISHSRETYPGTDERIVILTGEIGQIIDLHNYIIDKVADARGVDGTKNEKRGNMVKMILPNITAGLIIGKKGATIKGLKEESSAYIDLTGRDESPVQGERILTIKGNTEQRLDAARLVINKVASDPDNMANTSLKYSHRGGNGDQPQRNDRRGGDEQSRDQRRGGASRFDDNRREGNMGGGVPQPPRNPTAGLGMGGGGANLSGLAEVAQQLVGLAQQGQNQNIAGSIDGIKTTVQIQMEIPDVIVAPIVGINGNTLREFIQFSGAQIDFARSDLGLSHKLLTIRGDLNQTQIAYHLVNQKITQIRNELALRR